MDSIGFGIGGSFRSIHDTFLTKVNPDRWDELRIELSIGVLIEKCGFSYVWKIRQTVVEKREREKAINRSSHTNAWITQSKEFNQIIIFNWRINHWVAHCFRRASRSSTCRVLERRRAFTDVLSRRKQSPNESGSEAKRRGGRQVCVFNLIYFVVSFLFAD